MLAGSGVVTALSLFAAAPASASENASAGRQYDARVSACTNKPGMDMQECLSDMLEPVDSELQQALRSALKTAALQGRSTALANSQAAWEKFVSAQCAFELAQFQGGTGYWSSGNICQIRRKAARIDELARVARQ